MTSTWRTVRGLSLLYGFLPLAMLAAQQPGDGPHHAAPPSTSFWLGAQADLVGLQGPSSSPALYGGNAALAR